jgi:hypothetical protein
MSNKETEAILSLLQTLSQEELEKVAEFLKDLYSHPYGEAFIELHEGQIINKRYTKNSRYRLKKRENRNG